GLVNFNFGRFQVGGHYANTSVQGGEDVDSYMGGIAIADLFGAGNEFGVYGGISPVLSNPDIEPLMVEAYYQIAVNEFFTFTPAVIYADNDTGVGEEDNFYGALRATFSF
ncbi:MAG: porin, partial [Phormidesmis sp.]